MAGTIKLFTMDGLSGTSTEPYYRGWVPISNYTLGVAGEEGVEITISKSPDASTSDLATRARVGTNSGKGAIIERRTGKGIALIELVDVMIIKFEPKVVDRGAKHAVERITLRANGAEFKINSIGGSLESRHHPHRIGDPVPEYDPSWDRYDR